MSFKDQLKSDMANVFLNTSDFAESVIYTPLVGSPRTISAMVFRDPLESNLNVPRPRMHVVVENDSTLGIASNELNTGGDKITVAYRTGETPRQFNIRRSPVFGEDPGALRLELE